MLTRTLSLSLTPTLTRYGYTLSELKKPQLTLTLTLTLTPTLTRYGYTLSEFLPRVGWSGPFGTINCPFGHQAAEGRWLRRPDVMDNYSLFWFRHPQADLA